MNRRQFGATLALVGSCVAFHGCQALHHGPRGREQDRDPDVAHASAESTPTSTDSGSNPDKILDVQADAKNQKPFFRPSRLSGGLSSEAREIEDSLGIR